MNYDAEGNRIITVADLTDQDLADRMGEADLEEAAALRGILEEEYPETPVADIPEPEWLKLLDRAVIEAKGSLENGSNMPKPEVVTGYQYVTISFASGGFGEYDARNGHGDDIYADPSDIISESAPLEYVSTEHDDWDEDEDAELVDAIKDRRGSTHYEPEILVAARIQHGNYPAEIVVFGISSSDCYVLKSGEYVSVKDYNNSPESYVLARR